MLRKAWIGLAIGTLCAVPAAGQTVDDIIAKNLEARGGLQELKAVRTVRLAGRMTLGPGMEAPVVLELKRPNQMRLDMTIQGVTGTQAYDGKSGWVLMPFEGRTEPEPMPPEALALADEQADFDGLLIDYKTKGHTVELVGKEQVEGADTYKLKVAMKNGTQHYVYIDAEYYLEIRLESTRTVRGTEIESETSIGDYKEVGGLMWPHAYEGGLKGNPQRQKLTFEKIELNVPIDDARFRMPSVKQQ